MSMITPSGKNNKREWVPSDPSQLVKTANTEDGEVVEEADELLEAAIGVLENQKQAEVAEEEVVEAGKEDCDCDCDPCECKKDCDKDEIKEASFGEEEAAAPCESCGSTEDAGDADEIEIVLEEAPVEVEVSEESPVEEAPVEESVEEFVADAVEEIELVLEEVKEAVGGEVADEVVEDTTDFVADEVSDSVEEVVEVVEDSFETADEDEEAGCFATSKGTFVRLAGVSREVQEQIKSYWKDDLGFPADYVDLMFKNHE